MNRHCCWVFSLLLVLLAAGYSSATQYWYITSPASSISQGPTALPGLGAGLESDFANWYQYRWYEGSGWLVYGYTKMGPEESTTVIVTDELGNWSSTAYAEEGDPYPLSDYQTRIPNVAGTDPIVGFHIEESP